MTQSRQLQVSLSAKPYYHCISCCVRRAYTIYHLIKKANQ